MESSITERLSQKILPYKLLYTAGILAVYMLGREIPLYGIDFHRSREERLGAAELLMQADRKSTRLNSSHM